MDMHIADGWEDGPSLLELIWRYRLVVVAVTVLCGFTGLVIALFQGAQYEATAQLVLANPGTIGVFRQELGGSSVDMRQHRDNQLALIASRLVAERAADILGQDVKAVDLKKHVRAEAVGDASVMTVRATDATAEGAEAIASAVVQAYQERVAEAAQTRTRLAVEELQGKAAALRDRIGGLEPAERDAAIQRLAALENRADQVRVDAAVFGSGVEFLDPAAAPKASARPVRYGLAGALFGLLAATAFAFWHGERNVLAPHGPLDVAGASPLSETPEHRSANSASPESLAQEPRSRP